VRERTRPKNPGPAILHRTNWPAAVSAAWGKVPLPRAESEDHARHDSQQPPEGRRNEDDPDERLARRPKYPTHFDVACVGDDESDQDHEQRDEGARPGIEPGTAGMANDAVSPRLPAARSSGLLSSSMPCPKFSRSESGRNPADTC